MFQKIIAGVFGGLILGMLGANVLGCLFAPIEKEVDTTWVSILFFSLIWFPSIFIAIFFDTRAPRLWRRFLIASAICSFALPLAAFVGFLRAAHALPLPGHFPKETNDAIAVFGGSVASIMVGVFGFFLGAIFLTIGLLVGREKPVALPASPPDKPPLAYPEFGQPAPTAAVISSSVRTEDTDRRYYENFGKR